jgi:Transcriptional regulator containing an amidase domain and an AraC-type DNA-binding HTH domain
MDVMAKPLDDTNFDTLVVSGGTHDRAVDAGADRIPAAGLGSIPAHCRDLHRRVCAGRSGPARWPPRHHALVPARELQARFPEVKVEEDRIFIADGPVWTSAGATAGVDLALALIEGDFGADVARAVAKKLVVYHRRAGGQSQFSALLELEPKSDRIQGALAYAKRNLASKLSVTELAEAARLSPRQFSRAFHAETGQSPAKAIENLRVETARLMMEQSRHPVDVIARQTGFADRDRMRRAFLRAFGQPPQVIRRNARTEAAA